MSTTDFWKTAVSPGLGSLNELLLWARQRGQAPALAWKEPGSKGPWQTLSCEAFYERVLSLSVGLEAHGLKPGDRVALLSENRPEWLISDFACLALGLIDVPIYATLPGQQIVDILVDSGASAVLLSNGPQLEKLAPLLASVPGLRWMATFDKHAEQQCGGLPLLYWGDLLQPASDERRNAFDSRLRQTPGEQVATLIYTSGTTGSPRGVVLTHANLCSNLNVSSACLPGVSAARRLSFLPMSHIVERALSYVDLVGGFTTYYAESLEEVPRNLVESRPTLLAAVPRLYEKMAAKVQSDAACKPWLVRKLFQWALNVGQELAPYRLAGWDMHRGYVHTPIQQLDGTAALRPVPGGWLRLRATVADRLVYSKLRTALGGEVALAIAGGAPLGRELTEFLLRLGLVVDEGYGLTETAPLISINRPGARRPGSVGKLIPGVKLRVADDGELLVSGPGVFREYWGRPEETAAALREIGGEKWFATGDIGHMDGDGFIFITDRKKDLIKTSGGKFIAPQPIEARLKASPLVHEAVVVGDGRKYVSALLQPEVNALAAALGRPILPAEELCALPEAARLYEELVATVNKDLARFETVKRFRLLHTPFSIEGGDLTPTAKVRRRAVEQKYRDLIDSMYEPDVVAERQ